MRRQSAVWEIYGDGKMAERKLAFAYFYRRQIAQKWSPLMHEVTTEYGMRVGPIRLGWSWTAKHFFDGKEPAVIAGPY
jgi:hypothetical protein